MKPLIERMLAARFWRMYKHGISRWLIRLFVEWRTKKKDGKKTLVDELCEKAEAKGVKLTEEEAKSLLHKLFFDYIDRLEPQKEKTEDEE